MVDRPRQVGKGVEWRRDPRPDQDDMAAGADRISDLHPQRPGPSDAELEKSSRTAYDVKGAHRALSELADDQLRQIPVLPQGSRLEQGATYLDLNHLDRGEFVATGAQVAGHDNWFVPKSEVEHQIWNVLRGVTDPERLGLPDQR